MKTINSLSMLVLLLCSAMMGCNNDDPPSPPSPTINATDSLVMVDFYHSMKLDQWGEPYNWDLKDPTTWVGVGFLEDENGLKYVGGIQLLHGKNIDCSLPTNIGNLKYLVDLILHDIPFLQGTLPESIYDCPIISISIVDCPNLTGRLSSKIAKWGITLTDLNIYHTALGGEIPKEIGTCQSLLYLNLKGNKFSGTIPAEIVQIPCHANLEENLFTGIDWDIFLKDAINLAPQCAYNNFTGEIPQEVLESERWNSFNSFYPFNKGYGFSNYPYKDYEKH